MLAKPFKTWLFAIAKNTAIDHLRKKYPLPILSMEDDKDSAMAENIPDARPLASELFDQKITAHTLQSAITQISPKSRAVLLMHETEEMTFQEIANTMDESINTVKSRYRRALHVLRKILK